MLGLGEVQALKITRFDNRFLSNFEVIEHAEIIRNRGQKVNEKSRKNRLALPLKKTLLWHDQFPKQIARIGFRQACGISKKRTPGENVNCSSRDAH